MTEFKVEVIKNYGEDGTKIMGCDVVIWDGEDKYDTISILNAEQVQELEDKINNLGNSYITWEELVKFCENVNQLNNINASRLNGMDSGQFAKREHTHDGYLVKSHEDVVGGVGSRGHVEIVDNCSSSGVKGKALSANQGRLLSERIGLNTVEYERNSLRCFVGRSDYGDAGEQGTKLIINRGESIYVHAVCDVDGYNYGKLVAVIVLNGVAYTRVINSKGFSDSLKVNLESNPESKRNPYVIQVLIKGDGELNTASDLKLLYVN